MREQVQNPNNGSGTGSDFSLQLEELKPPSAEEILKKAEEAKKKQKQKKEQPRIHSCCFSRW